MTNKVSVKKKYVQPKCPHGKQKRYCSECGGYSMCEHGKQPYFCKACNGSGICEHGNQKNRCKECGGSSLCEHGNGRIVVKNVVVVLVNIGE